MTKTEHRLELAAIAIVGIALLAGGLFGIYYPAPLSPPPGWHGKVTEVHDGDTCKIQHGEKVETIRLAGIDAPELKQPFGPESRDWLAGQCQGQEVRVVESGRDRYGRTIADVYAGRRWLNRETVSRGLAWHYTQYSTNKDIAAAEADARAARRGLWFGLDSEHPPIEPWIWRKSQR